MTIDGITMTVPGSPGQVVVTDLYLVSALFDLGLKPAGVPTGVLTPQVFPKEVLDWAGSPAQIGISGEPSPEAVLKAGPDLILDQFYPEKTAQLSSVAPVVFIDWRKSGRTWREQIALVAEATNRTADLEVKKAAYQRRVDEMKAAHGPVLKDLTWAVASGSGQGGWVLGSPAVDVLRDLGATLLPGMTSSFITNSTERLDLLATADVVLYPELFTGTAPAPTSALHATGVWRDLPAVRAGRSRPIRYSSVSSYHWAVALIGEIEAVLRRL